MILTLTERIGGFTGIGSSAPVSPLPACFAVCVRWRGVKSSIECRVITGTYYCCRMKTIRQNFFRKGRPRLMTKGICKWYQVCPMKRFYEEGRLEKTWVERYCWNDNRSCIRYQLEERGEPHPDNLLPNGEIRQELQ